MFVRLVTPLPAEEGLGVRSVPIEPAPGNADEGKMGNTNRKPPRARPACFTHYVLSSIMYKLFATWALLALPVTVLAQFSVFGTITDAADTAPLAGVHVTISGTTKGTYTDTSGNYRLTGLPAGTYTLRVSSVGYEKVSQTVNVQENVTVHFPLNRATILADEVMVRATRAADHSPTTYTNISKEYIENSNFGQDFPFLLNQTPSVVVTSDAGAGVGYTGIRIRGSDPTRINVTINGIPYNDAESQGTFWVNMPDFASSVDNIQVQRGVGTSTNGAGAFGGSINVQTTTLNQEASGEVNNTYGSFNTWRHTVKIGSGLIDGKWSVDGRLSKIASDGYIDRASSDLKSFFVSGGYSGKSTIIRANVFSGKEITYQSWSGVPENLLATNRTYNPYTYDNEVDNYQQDNYQFILSHTLHQSWNLNAALHYTRGRGYYEQFKPADDPFGEGLYSAYGLPDVQIGDSVIESTDFIRRRWLDNYFYGATYSINYSGNGKLSGTLGGGWNQYDGKHFGEIVWARISGNTDIRDRYYENDALKTDFNSYAKATYQLTGALSAFADLQYRRIDYSFFGYDNDQNNVQQEVKLNFFNPKGGLTYQFNPNTNVYASYSIGNREPTRDDYTQSTPQSRPKPETLRNLEAGFRKTGKRGSLNVNYYLMDYRNQLVLTGQINDVGAYNRVNIPRSFRTGIEVDGNVQLTKKLTISANATVSRNKIRNYREFVDNYDSGEQVITEFSTTDISFSPDFIAASTVSYAPVKNLSLNLVSKYVGGQFLDNTSNKNRRLDAFLANDLRIHYTIKPTFMKEIGLNLLLNNILDEFYEPNGYTFSYIAEGALTTENYYYPQAGRNFLVSVQVKF